MAAREHAEARRWTKSAEVDPGGAEVDRVLDRVAMAREEELPPERSVVLRSGRELRALTSDREDLVEVRSPRGEIELSVRFTDDGPVLKFQAAALDLKTPGEMNVECGKFRVVSADSIDLETEGDLTQRVKGGMTTEVGRKGSLEAHAWEVRSRRGNVLVKANDDVVVRGERIKLN